MVDNGADEAMRIGSAYVLMSIAKARVQQGWRKKTDDNNSGKGYKLRNNASAIFHGFMACFGPIGTDSIFLA